MNTLLQGEHATTTTSGTDFIDFFVAFACSGNPQHTVTHVVYLPIPRITHMHTHTLGSSLAVIATSTAKAKHCCVDRCESGD